MKDRSGQNIRRGDVWHASESATRSMRSMRHTVPVRGPCGTTSPIKHVRIVTVRTPAISGKAATAMKLMANISGLAAMCWRRAARLISYGRKTPMCHAAATARWMHAGMPVTSLVSGTAPVHHHGR